jgi:hypothetical protein
LKEYRIQVYRRSEHLNNLIYDSNTIYAIPNYVTNSYGIDTIIDLNDTQINETYLIKIILNTNNNFIKEEKRYLIIKEYDSIYFQDNDTYK